MSLCPVLDKLSLRETPAQPAASGVSRCEGRMLQQRCRIQRSNLANHCLFCAGHSLGGAMAVLAAYDIAELCPWKSVQVYTVGAPRPGNKAFADRYNARVPDTWHVINPKVGHHHMQSSQRTHTHTRTVTCISWQHADRALLSYLYAWCASLHAFNVSQLHSSTALSREQAGSALCRSL